MLDGWLSGLALMAVIGMPLRTLPREIVGTGMGLVNAGGQLPGVVAPLATGGLAQDVGFAAAFGFLAATTLAAAPITLTAPLR